MDSSKSASAFASTDPPKKTDVSSESDGGSSRGKLKVLKKQNCVQFLISYGLFTILYGLVFLV